MTARDARGLLAPLFVPADRPERFAKAAASGADAIIVDLEDAVAPAAKDAARAGLAASLPAGERVVVRVNAAGTPWHDADVSFVARHPGLGLMLPKAEDATTVTRLAARIGANRILVALVESALGVHRAMDIAGAPGVTQMAFGPADFCNDIGCDDGNEALLLARATLVLAARVGGLAAPSTARASISANRRGRRPPHAMPAASASAASSASIPPRSPGCAPRSGRPRPRRNGRGRCLPRGGRRRGGGRRHDGRCPSARPRPPHPRPVRPVVAAGDWQDPALCGTSLSGPGGRRLRAVRRRGGGTAMRVAFVMKLKPGCEAIYKQKHDEIWPELVELLRRQGVRNYSIFRHGLTLFAYFERDAPPPEGRTTPSSSAGGR